MSTSDYKMEIDNPTKEKAIKTAVNDISTDLASISKDVQSLSDQLPALMATRSEINWFRDQTERYNTRLTTAAAVIEKGVHVRVDPAKLSGEDVQLLNGLNEKFEVWNRRWSTLCKAIASTGKIKVVFTAIVSALITAAFMLLAYENSPHVWSHRALVAAEESHMENPLDEYSKAFAQMRGGIKSRKDCKDRIEGMESDAWYIKKLEGVLSDYTEEELEVRKHKVNIKDEQLARLVCYHPSTDQMINYRIHTNSEGVVTKVEKEKKTKSKVIWEELKILSTE
jgi:hypothetical protein